MHTDRHFVNLALIGFMGTGKTSAGRLVGLPGSPLRALSLENVDIQARTGFTIGHTAGLRFKNVKVNGRIVAPPEEKIAGR